MKKPIIIKKLPGETAHKAIVRYLKTKYLKGKKH
jgi:hypothetical protein